MIPQRIKRPKMGVRDPEKVRNQKHLQWIRGFLCAVADQSTCSGRIEAHHVRETIDGRAGGIGLKPDDSAAVPLCAGHHAELHSMGVKTFEARHHVDLDQAAKTLWQKSPHRPREAA